MKAGFDIQSFLLHLQNKLRVYEQRRETENRRKDYRHAENRIRSGNSGQCIRLGLIYKIDLQDDGELSVDMTLTAPNCPAADFIMEDIRQKVESVEGVKAAQGNLVVEPEWDKDMMTEEAKLELGFL